MTGCTSSKTATAVLGSPTDPELSKENRETVLSVALPEELVNLSQKHLSDFLSSLISYNKVIYPFSSQSLRGLMYYPGSIRSVGGAKKEIQHPSHETHGGPRVRDA